MRGAIHVHGMVRLKSDPGLVDLSKKVIVGRRAERTLACYAAIRTGRDTEIAAFQAKYPFDTYIQSLQDLRQVLQGHLNEKSQAEMEAIYEQLRAHIVEGETAHTKIVVYRDYLLSSLNTSNPLPPDANLDTRHAMGELDPNFQHPSAKCHTHSDPPSFATDDLYCQLCNITMRHWCQPTYCMRDNKCRFHFPRPLALHSSVRITEKKYSSGHATKSGQLRKVALDIVPATNDRWFNGHCRSAMMAWGGNCDFALLVDFDAQLNYIAKYSTKSEENSNGFQAIFRTALQKARDNEAQGNAVIRTIFIRSSAGREKCHQETSHLALSLPMVRCSEKFVFVNLYNNSRSVIVQPTAANNNPPPLVEGHDDNDGADGGDGGPVPAARNVGVIKATLMDFYALRTDPLKWCEPLRRVFDQLLPTIRSMSLIEFASFYNVGKDLLIAKHEQRYIVVTSPEFSSNSHSSNYSEYCYFNLLKYKPWEQHQEQVYGGVRGGFKDDIQSKDRRAAIEAAWRIFLDTHPADDIPDFIQQKIDMLRNREDRIEWTQYDDMPNLDIDEDIADDDYTHLCRMALLGPGIHDEGACEWNRDHNWGAQANHYDVDLLSKEAVQMLWDNVHALQDNIIPEYRQVMRNDLRHNQVVAFDIASTLIINPPPNHNKLMILISNQFSMLLSSTNI